MPEDLYVVVARVLDIPVEIVTDQKSPDDLEKWDSMGHFALVTELEATYDVLFEDDEVMKMLTVGHIRRILRQHGVDL